MPPVFQLSSGTSWAQSALESLKIQCSQAVSRDLSLADSVGGEVLDQIEAGMCFNECSLQGQCVQGERV